MSCTDKFVLPFRWREFGRWYKDCGKIDAENANGRLKICAADFASDTRKLRGIRVRGEITVNSSRFSELYLCAFLADLGRNELLEPFIGNPDSFVGRAVESSPVTLELAQSQKFEIFIPEQGWILPSIWRFLMHSIGLRRKTSERMPDILVLAFLPDTNIPVFSTSVPFDYFGSASHLQEELVLKEFFSTLKLRPSASEAEVHAAYIASCRRFQELIPDCVSPIVWRRRTSMFSRIKHGYHIWAERLQMRRNQY